MKATELQKKIKEGSVVLLDVRTDVEYRSGAIEGAAHLPVDELERLSRYDAPLAGKQLCLICQSGKRAERARRHLLDCCGVEACVLENGMNGWTEAGLPVVRQAGAPLPLIRQVQMIIGLMNLMGIALGIWVDPLWIILPAFTSLGLFVAGVTGFCGLAVLLSKMPWNRP